MTEALYHTGAGYAGASSAATAGVRVDPSIASERQLAYNCLSESKGRVMLRLHSFQSFTVVLLTACGGNVVVDGTRPAGGNATGGQGATGAPGAGATSTNGGNGSVLTGGIECISEDQWNQIDNAACAGWQSEVEDVRYLFEFVVDVSGSMSDLAPNTGVRSKWEVTRDALSTAIDSILSPNSAGLLLYPNKSTVPNPSMTWQPVDYCIDISSAVAPQFLGALGSTQRVAIASALTLATPRGGTPTEDAYAFALNSHVLPTINTPPYLAPIVVLITDGSPTFALGCEGAGQAANPTDTQPVIQAIADAWANHSVRTIVIGLPESENSSVIISDPRIWMSQAASAGHGSITGSCSDSGIPNFCHVDLTNVADLQSGLVSAVQSIMASQGQLILCSYEVPPPPNGQTLDPSKFYFVYSQTASGSTTPTRCLIGQSSPDCSQGDGWYLDAVTGSINLCAKTCATIQKDPTANVDVLGACFYPHGIE